MKCFTDCWMTKRLKLRLESRSMEKKGKSRTCFYISQADHEQQTQQRPLPEDIQTGHTHRDSVVTVVSGKPKSWPGGRGTLLQVSIFVLHKCYPPHPISGIPTRNKVIFKRKPTLSPYLRGLVSMHHATHPSSSRCTTPDPPARQELNQL